MILILLVECLFSVLPITIPPGVKMRWPNGIADHLANVERALQQQTKIQRKNPYQRFSVTAVLDKSY
jgi:hypothetical protein